MMVLLLKIVPSPENRRELLGILKSVVGPSSIQPGCQTCEIYEGSLDNEAVLFVERWDSLSNMNDYIRSALFARLLVAMEMSTRQPEIQFYETAQVCGMDHVESLRTAEKL